MEKGNVLVIGNSGVGKSTLINAVLGEDVAKTGWGTHGTTDRLEIYTSQTKETPFNVIDSIGFEPGFLKETRAINAVKQWSKDCAKSGDENHQINVIWFCVEGTSSKLFPKTIRAFIRATTVWESVPVIIVITKSYSIPEREQNIKLVHQALETQRGSRINVKKIIPVVAAPYVINENAFAPPDGISELIGATNELMPEGQKAAKGDLAKFVLRRKRILAQSIVTAATTAGVVVGAIPIPFSDAILLTPTEVAEVNSIAKIYDIGKDEDHKRFLNSIVEVGTVGIAAKALISAIKAIPGINLAASVINAVIAGIIVTALGEGSFYAFEQVYLGNKSVTDIDWVKKVIESKLSLSIIEKAKTAFAKLSDTSSAKDVASVVLELMASIFGSNRERSEESE